ncbi:two-component regulator propeller domain-containing protein [uncultured Bacteroides sp.]|uniref:hybrid sensor histidine kinase/response regulator transcription factor n=1 Tax=uncultured Bacteroides sp. TaxID=162156 RepID=UPI002AAABEA6|nr:two-component regulator propeller domain-containing protein [uncultured Bacteroides sp.]
MRKYLYLFALLTTLSLLTLKAESNAFSFRRYTVDNGLSSNIVRSILQDKRGFIWIGTEEGLNCFDGQTIKKYLSNNNAPYTLGNNYVNALYEDSEGKLWIGTDTGIYLYEYEKAQFYLFRPQTKAGITITSIVNNITGDKEGNVWIATYGQGIFKYNLLSRRIEQYMLLGQQKNFINYVYVDKEGEVWAAPKLPKKPLMKYNKKRNCFENFPLMLASGDRESTILYIIQASEGELWLGTWDDGIRKLDKKTGEITTYLSPQVKGGVLHIHSITEVKKGVLMIGSDDGLSVLNTSTGRHQLLTSDETDMTSLSNKFIYPIIKDREGGIWVGTYYGGVNYLSPNSGMFQGYAHSHFRNSINGDIVSRFCEDKKGNIWIGTDDGGLNCYNPQTKLFKNYMPEVGRNSLSYHNVHALCLDDDKLWIGTYSGGLNVMNLKTGHFRHYNTDEKDLRTLDGSSIYAIFKDREKRVWVTSMSGVNLYHPETDDFTRVKDFGFMTIDIKQDKDGYLWFATQGKGLFRYSPSKNEWRNYIHEADDEHSVISNSVNSLCVDSKGTLWVGTGDGLCFYEPSKDEFISVTLKIPSSNICCIIESDGVLWLTTSRGLVRYDRYAMNEDNCQVFTKSDGLQSDQFIFNSGLKSSSGEMYVGTLKGFNTFCPDKIKKNVYVPPVFITSLEIFNKEILVDPNGLLPVDLSDLDCLHLSYKKNVFSLRYAALSYSTPEKNKYAYKLEGFDEDWNDVGGQTKATYTNLPAGTYIFKVKACNNDGLWNEKGAQLRIVIHPPLYLTLGFKIIYFVLLVLLIFWVIRSLVSRSERRHKEKIKELEQKKEKEVYDSKIQFFTMIAHEIRTPVSLIIGPMEKIMSADSSLSGVIRKELDIINRNSQRLLTLVNQLLDFRKVEQGAFRLTPAKCTIYDLLKNVYERFDPLLKQRGIEFVFNCSDKEFEAMIDPEAITKAVSNLLTNANKFTKDHILLQCLLDTKQLCFRIEVTDNGCGIPKEEKEKIFQPFYQISAGAKPGTGIGLNLVKSIVEAHGGMVEVISTVGQGSSFIITLPMESMVSDVGYGSSLSENVPSVENFVLQSENSQRHFDENNLRLLIVDDNEEMRTFLADSFLDEYQIITAKDGLDALSELEKANVSLIISDLMMPRMDGLAFCKVLHDDVHYNHIPIVLLTAKTDLTSKIEGMDIGADIYVEKPFSIQYLRACVRNLLASRVMLKNKFSEMPFVPLNSIAVNKAEKKFLAQMNEVIEKNFSNMDFSVDVLAKELCISRSGLFAKIKTMMDVTPNELIQLVRLKKAAQLLAEKDMRINEVAYAVGFNNPSYFAKCFQKQFGQKPMDFVLKWKKK